MNEHLKHFYAKKVLLDDRGEIEPKTRKTCSQDQVVQTYQMQLKYTYYASRESNRKNLKLNLMNCYKVDKVINGRQDVKNCC